MNKRYKKLIFNFDKIFKLLKCRKEINCNDYHKIEFVMKLDKIDAIIGLSKQ